jgi:dipeptidyl aminopeptidase/acylaminoacyl peptidase
VQRDIVEGTEQLLARGIGARGRVGIVGSSFGGYSALLGATFSPELFRVAVAAMPPADFGWVLRWQTQREAAEGVRRIGLAASLKTLGLDRGDPALIARLAAEAPLANAARLRRPVLLVAGGQDRSVPLRSVVDYAARLRVLGRDVALFVDPKSGHRLDDPETQDQYLYLLATMLHRHLGGPAEPAPAGATGLALRRNLRLPGEALGGPR